jgi:hypothetical protein
MSEDAMRSKERVSNNYFYLFVFLTLYNWIE